MDRDIHPAAVTACAAVDLLLRMGRESYQPNILADPTSAVLVSPLAGQEFRTELVQHMCVGPRVADADVNLHVTLLLDCGGHDVQAYCKVGSYNQRARTVEAFVYVDGEYVLWRNVSVLPDGRLRPLGMPDELRLYDPGFEPVVCDICGVTVMQTVQRGMYFTCGFDGDVINSNAATMFYGWTPIREMTAAHLEDGRHAICV